MANLNSEAWLTRAADSLVSDIFEPAGFGTNGNTGEPLSEHLRARVGYPLANALRKDIKAIGMCMPSSASAGQFTEIFISPVLGKGSPMPGGDHPHTLLMTLAHEIAHAVAGYTAAHGPQFVKVIEGIGIVIDKYPVTPENDSRAGLNGLPLSGQPVDPRTAGSDLTTISPAFAAYCDKLIKKLGEYDHYAITTETMPRASTRLLKEVCVNDACPGHVGNKRNNARKTWYWAKQGTDFCGLCKERMSIYLPRAKGTKGKGAGEKDPNAVPVAIDSDGTMTDTPLSENPNTPFHTDDEDDDEPGGAGDEPSDEADGPGGDEVMDEPSDEDDEDAPTTTTKGEGQIVEDKNAKGKPKGSNPKQHGSGKSAVKDETIITGPHKTSMTCQCEQCAADRAAAGL